MSDEEWRKHLIEMLGYEPRDYFSEVVVSDAGGIREIEVNQADGSTSMAHGDGSGAAFEIRGPAPRNEDDVEEVLRVLARHLSVDGATWSSKVRDQERESGADGWLSNVSGESIDVQVTRALGDSRLMRELSQGTVVDTVSSNEVAESILEAARRKASPRRGPASARREIVLALDASRLPHAILPGVVESLRRLADQFTALGFRAVYLVGKNHDRTIRLDVGARLDSKP